MSSDKNDLSDELADGSMSVGDFIKVARWSFLLKNRMAKGFLSTPAISAPSVVLLSKMSNVVMKKRNLGLCNTFKLLAILKSQNIILDSLELVFDEEEGSTEVEEKPKVSKNEAERYISSDDHNDDERKTKIKS